MKTDFAFKNHIKVTECLCDHDECRGQYTDSLGLGLTLNCYCFCQYDRKVEGMEGYPPAQAPTNRCSHRQEGGDTII